VRDIYHHYYHSSATDSDVDSAADGSSLYSSRRPQTAYNHRRSRSRANTTIHGGIDDDAWLSQTLSDVGVVRRMSNFGTDYHRKVGTGILPRWRNRRFRNNSGLNQPRDRTTQHEEPSQRLPRSSAPLEASHGWRRPISSTPSPRSHTPEKAANSAKWITRPNWPRLTMFRRPGSSTRDLETGSSQMATLEKGRAELRSAEMDNSYVDST
jgi:hypothetical protein